MLPGSAKAFLKACGEGLGRREDCETFDVPKSCVGFVLGQYAPSLAPRLISYLGASRILVSHDEYIKLDV